MYLNHLRFQRSLESVNSHQVHLLSDVQPPNYNAVKPKHLVSDEQPPNYSDMKQTLSMFTSSKTDYLLPPPLYNAVFNV